MKDLKKILRVKDNNQFILAIVFIVYIVLNIRTPRAVAKIVDTPLGKGVCILAAISMFMNCSPVIGILGIIAVSVLIKRSSVATGSHAVKHLQTSEREKVKDFSRYNDFPVTLEEEIVRRMAPLVKHPPSKNSNYKPLFDATHHAAPIDYNGVV